MDQSILGSHHSLYPKSPVWRGILKYYRSADLRFSSYLQGQFVGVEGCTAAVEHQEHVYDLCRDVAEREVGDGHLLVKLPVVALVDEAGGPCDGVLGPRIS